MNCSRNVQTYLQLRNKVHKLINMGTHLPITRTAQSVFNVVSNIFRLHLNYLFTLTSPLLLPVKTKMSAAVSVPLSAWLSPVRSAAGNKLNLEGSCSVISSAAICQPGCNLSARLQYVRAAATSKLSSTADCQFGCNSSNQVCLVSSAAHVQNGCKLEALHLTVLVQLCFVSSLAICLLSCILSHNVAQLYFPVLTVSPGNCAVGAGAKCSDVAALVSLASHGS